MKIAVAFLLGTMVVSVGAAQARKQRTAAKPKPDVEAVACTEAKAAFIERFSQLVSTFHDQVELAEVTPRIALTQRVADLQRASLDLKNIAIPPCAVASGTFAGVIGRETTAMTMDLFATVTIPGDTTGPAAERMRKSVQEVQSSDDEIDALCKGLTKEKAQNIRLQVWKSDANSAAKFEIKRFLTFMKAASSEPDSFDARQAVAVSAVYGAAARLFWRTTATGRQ